MPWRNPLVAAWIGTVALGLGEVGARARVALSPSYYAARSDPAEGVMRYPFGDIRFGREGFPDEVPPPHDPRPRAVYLGDSVTVGIGAGTGHRFTEVLDQALPGVHHINVGMVGWPGPTADNLHQLHKHLPRLRPDRLVYLLNLNDVLPAESAPPPAPRIPSVLLAQLGHAAILWSHRLGAPRPPTPEFFPQAERARYAELASRVRLLAEQVPVPLDVVVLPYEMQVSAEAATVAYRAGVRWEPGFVEGAPQQVLTELLEEFPLHDAREALAPEGADLAAGECFVHLDGGRLDTNHLDREGHRRLGTWMAGWLPDQDQVMAAANKSWAP